MIALGIYLLGYVLSYIYLKMDHKKYGIWTKGDRVECLLASLLSWIAILIQWIVISKNNKEPAKW